MNSGMTGTIMLPDGSKVWLNSNTHIKYPSEFAQDRREVELNGEAYFSVERDPNRKFIVHSVEDQVTIEYLVRILMSMRIRIMDLSRPH